MNRAEAKKKFAKELEIACRACKASVGELCVENRAVWIHAERFVDREKLGISSYLTPTKENPVP